MVTAGEGCGPWSVMPLSAVPDRETGATGKDPEGTVVKRVLGDDYGELELVTSLGSDLTVVNAARVSYSKKSRELGDKDNRLISFLANAGHTSPFRHVQFQFRVKAPEFVGRQWYKHVVGSDYTFKDTAWNEVSQRYVEVPLEFYTPKEWRGQDQKNKQASVDGFTHATQDAATRAHFQAETACATAYLKLIDLGVAREQARMALPLSIYTEWYWTASLQAVAHFINLRNKPEAQWETRQYAIVMAALAMKVAPIALDALMRIGASTKQT